MAIIREATEKETREIIKHGLEVMKEATAGHVTPSFELVHQHVTEFLSSGGYYLVYIEQETIRGWVGVGTSYNMYQNEPIGILYELYVLPAYRNRGIAKRLCLEAMKILSGNGLTSIELNVFSGNEAKELYRKLGFWEVVTTMKWDGGSN